MKLPIRSMQQKDSKKKLKGTSDKRDKFLK